MTPEHGTKPVPYRIDGGSFLRKFLVRLIAILLGLAIIGLVGYAYVGDLSPERGEKSVPVSVTFD
ncbi:hypothetical protein SAMN05444421_10887 [Celeribacter marinus]|uniref:Uncharacterized protein n=1 Tax=Celeribacter marinus TaxID=1397108 RepID=A0A0P0A8X7_9RHOB|nr:hypothetical protein IMCC12053_524 [Celeribacter marinus]SFK77858.1 hypothetical protein SAMN05444421_10887 [Celeribacter marinus]